MYRISLLFILGLSTISTYAQNTFPATGNVGIGTSTPAYNLQVKSGGPAGVNIETTADSHSYLELKGANKTWQISKRQAVDNNALWFTYHNGSSWVYPPALILATNGNVGIGAAPGSFFKLAVDGKIGAREVQVTLQNPWPDYVFKQSYNLMPLMTLSEYIQKNSHLPGLPSAEEVEAKKGFELGELSVKYLEKIEELTLYIIELKKEVDALKESRAQNGN